MHYVTTAIYKMIHHVEMFGPRQWTVFALAALAVGLICMRGFGNRAY
jgi:hypothetical protein